MCRNNNRNRTFVGPAVVAGQEDGATKTVRPTTIVTTAQIHTTPGMTTTTEDKDAVVITNVEAASGVATRGQRKGNRDKLSTSKSRQMTKAE